MSLENLIKNPQEMEKAEWKAVLEALNQSREYLCKEGVNHTWMDGAIGIAKERSEGKGTYAPQIGTDKEAIDLSASNWAGVFHTAFRHAGDSNHASTAHTAISEMRGGEWNNIVDYMLIGIRQKLGLPKWS